MRLLGRLVEASNATFLAEEGDGGHVVYKPVAGEAPLWDFPSGTLGRREVAAYELSRAAGFDVVPPTRWADDAPLGPGSVQRWVEADGDDLAALVPVDQVPDGWFGVVLGLDDEDHEVVLVHADHPGLRRLALFDVVANNADRKAGHVIRRGDGVLGCDHGVSFHAEPKLRTILWGWAGEPLTPAETDLLRRTVEVAAQVLDPWLGAREAEACEQRALGLLADGHFPEPGDAWPVIPWPPI
ncbi:MULTISPECIES: SCO1664 family protein [unclassified Luteococcus]|uniref:SCO1664 family protein n=1 Tax=unclassified Luteococcus TaxID=2639923 RepID=UPI00313E0BE4